MPNGSIGAQGTYVRGEWIPAGGIAIVDPRCAVWDDQARLVSNPRDHVARMDRAMRRWMDEHPRWPPSDRRKPAEDAPAIAIRLQHRRRRFTLRRHPGPPKRRGPGTTLCLQPTVRIQTNTAGESVGLCTKHTRQFDAELQRQPPEDR